MTTILTPQRGGLAAMFALLFALGATPAEAQDKPVTLVMPACPITATTVPLNTTQFPIPSADPLAAALNVAGTVQVADQSGGVILKTSVAFDVLPTGGIDFARTINTIQHVTGQVSFDKGCTKTDPYGSNTCHWDYGQMVQMASQGALQEDVTAGKIVVDLTLNSTTPFQFTCPVCGGTCAITVPEQFDQSEIWALFFSLVPFPAFLIHVPSPPAAPTIAASFTPSTIVTDGTSALGFTLTNPNSGIALTGAGFTDSLPAGMVVSTPNGLSGSCGGGMIAATAAGSSVSLTGAALDPGASCTFSIGVTSSQAGNYVNTTGAVTANESFTGLTATATSDVEAPPSIAKVFNPSEIGLNATSALTFTITNPAANPVAETGVAFSDTLPSGLTVASATATVCGGTLTTTAPTSIALSGAAIATNSNCQFSVTITGTVSGSYTNTTAPVSSANGGTGNTANANLTVDSPPMVTNAFGAGTIPLNGTTSLSVTINNPNMSSMTGVAFTNNLPAGLVIAATPNVANTCGGTVTAAAGSGTFSLSAGAIGSMASCAVSVNVKGASLGVETDSVQVSSSAGISALASNDLTVIQDAQTITFTSTPPASAAVTGSYVVSASASSGLAIAFSIDANSTAGACTISGNVVSFTGTGSCIVDANQSGDTNYTPAPQAQQTMTIGKKTTTVSLVVTPDSIAPNQSVTITATVAGDPPSGTARFTDNGATLPCSPVTLVPGATSSTAVCTAVLAATGSHSIVATYSGDANFAGATSSAAVVAVSADASAAPTLDRWAMTLLGGLLGVAVFMRLRRGWQYGR